MIQTKPKKVQNKKLKKTNKKQDVFVNIGQDHKDKYFDTSRKILSQEMTMCNMEALVSYL